MGIGFSRQGERIGVNRFGISIIGDATTLAGGVASGKILLQSEAAAPAGWALAGTLDDNFAKDGKKFYFVRSNTPMGLLYSIRGPAMDSVLQPIAKTVGVTFTSLISVFGKVVGDIVAGKMDDAVRIVGAQIPGITQEQRENIVKSFQTVIKTGEQPARFNIEKYSLSGFIGNGVMSIYTGAGDNMPGNFVIGDEASNLAAIAAFASPLAVKHRTEQLEQILDTLDNAFKMELGSGSVEERANKLLAKIGGIRRVKDTDEVSDRLCGAVANAINKVYGTIVIDMKMPTASKCNGIRAVILSLLAKSQTEFLSIASATNTLIAITWVLSDLAAKYAEELADIAEQDPSAEKRVKMAKLANVLRTFHIEIRKNIMILKNVQSSTLGPIDAKLVDIFRGSDDLTRAITGATKANLIGVRDGIQAAVSAIRKTGEMVALQNVLNQALQTLGISIADFKKKTRPELTKIMTEKALKAFDAAPNTEAKDKFFYAIELINDLFEIREDLGKSGSGEKSGACGCAAPGVGGMGETGGVGDNISDEDFERIGAAEIKADKQVNQQKMIVNLILKTFSGSARDMYRTIVKSVMDIAERIGPDAPVTDDLLAFRDSISRINAASIGYKNIAMALLGYFRDSTSRAHHDEFIAQFEDVAQHASILAANPAYSKIASLLAGLKTQISQLIELVERMSKEMSSRSGGDDDRKPIEIEDLPNIFTKELTDEMRDHFNHKINAAQIRANFAGIHEELKRYAEDYEKLVAETTAGEIETAMKHAGEKENKLAKNPADLTNVANGAAAVAAAAAAAAAAAGGGPGAAAAAGVAAAAVFDPPHYRGAANAAEDKDTTPFISAAGQWTKRCCAAKKKFWQTMEAIDAYMREFTDGIVSHPDDVKGIRDMLDGVEVISQWYNDKAGDKLMQLFLSLPSFENGGRAHAFHFGKDMGLINSYELKANKGIQGGAAAAIDLDGASNANAVVPQNIGEWFKLAEVAAPVYGASNPFVADSPDRMEARRKELDEVLRNFVALKNLISIFVHFGGKFGGEALRKKVFMTPAQIYNNLVEFLTTASFIQGVWTDGNGLPVTDSTLQLRDEYLFPTETMNVVAVGSKSKVTITANSATVPIGLMLNPTADNNYFVPGKEGTGIYSQVAAYGVAMTAASGTKIGEVQAFRNPRGFHKEFTMFAQALKAIAAKILTVTGLNDIFERPLESGRTVASPVRMILGAGVGDSPKIIPAAIELYWRLPLLALFYKTLFNKIMGKDGGYTNKKKIGIYNKDELLISLVPDFNGAFSGLVNLMFLRIEGEDIGLYSDSEMKDLIREINIIYEKEAPKHKGDAMRGIIKSFIYEVNRRYGLISKENYQKIRRAHNPQIFEKTRGYDEKFEIDLLPGEFDDEYSRSAPSEQYIESKSSKKQNKFPADFGQIADLVKTFRCEIDKMLFEDAGSGEGEKLGFRQVVKETTAKLQTLQSADEQFKLVAGMVRGRGAIAQPDVYKYVMFHETVISGLNLLSFVYSKLHQFYVTASLLNLNKLVKIAIAVAASGSFTKGDLYTKITEYMQNECGAAYKNDIKTQNMILALMGFGADWTINGGSRPIEHNMIGNQLNNVNFAPMNCQYVAHAATPALSCNDILARMQANAGERELLAPMIFNHDLIMKMIIELVIGIGNDLQGLMEVRIENSKIYASFGGLKDHVKNLFERVKYFTEMMRSHMSKNLIKKVTDGANPGSYQWLYENLYEKMIVGRKAAEAPDVMVVKESQSLDELFVNLNMTFNSIIKYKQLDVATPPTMDFLAIAAGAGFTASQGTVQNSFDRIFSELIFYDSTKPECGLIDDRNPEPFMTIEHDPLDASIEPPATEAIDKPAHIFEHSAGVNYYEYDLYEPFIRPAILSSDPMNFESLMLMRGQDEDKSYDMKYAARYPTLYDFDKPLNSNRSVLLLFNQLIAKYLSSFCEPGAFKIYGGLINQFINGPFSSALGEPTSKTYPDMPPCVYFTCKKNGPELSGSGKLKVSKRAPGLGVEKRADTYWVPIACDDGIFDSADGIVRKIKDLNARAEPATADAVKSLIGELGEMCPKFAELFAPYLAGLTAETSASSIIYNLYTIFAHRMLPVRVAIAGAAAGAKLAAIRAAFDGTSTAAQYDNAEAAWAVVKPRSTAPAITNRATADRAIKIIAKELSELVAGQSAAFKNSIIQYNSFIVGACTEANTRAQNIAAMVAAAIAAAVAGVPVPAPAPALAAGVETDIYNAIVATSMLLGGRVIQPPKNTTEVKEILKDEKFLEFFDIFEQNRTDDGIFIAASFYYSFYGHKKFLPFASIYNTPTLNPNGAGDHRHSNYRPETSWRFGRRRDADSEHVLFQSLALALRRLTREVDKNKKPTHIVENVAELPAFMKERVRAYTPMFRNLFQSLINRCNIIMKFLHSDVLVDRRFDRAMLHNNAAVGLLTGNDMFDPYPFVLPESVADSKTIKPRWGGILDAVVKGCTSLIAGCEQTLREVGDDPKYLELYQGSIKEYKTQYGTEPFMPLSSVLSTMSNLKWEDRGYFIPSSSTSGADYRMLYGIRGLIMQQTSAPTLEQAPGVIDLLNKFNMLSAQKLQVDKTNMQEFFNSFVRLSRMLFDMKFIRGNLTSAISDFENPVVGALVNTNYFTFKSFGDYGPTMWSHEHVKATLSKNVDIAAIDVSLAAAAALAPAPMVEADVTAIVNPGTPDIPFRQELYGGVFCRCPVVIDSVMANGTARLLAVPRQGTTGTASAYLNDASGVSSDWLAIIPAADRRFLDFAAADICTGSIWQLSENLKEAIHLTEIFDKDSQIMDIAKHIEQKTLAASNVVIKNIVDLNISPINVHALMRGIPFINIFNYAYTFDRMIVDLFYGLGTSTAKNFLTEYCDKKPIPAKTAKDVLVKMLIDPYQDYKFWDGKGYDLFKSMMLGAAESGDLGRPKFLSDQLLVKVLGGNIGTETSETGPVARRFDPDVALQEFLKTIFLSRMILGGILPNSNLSAAQLSSLNAIRYVPDWKTNGGIDNIALFDKPFFNAYQHFLLNPGYVPTPKTRYEFPINLIANNTHNTIINRVFDAAENETLTSALRLAAANRNIYLPRHCTDGADNELFKAAANVNAAGASTNDMTASFDALKTNVFNPNAAGIDDIIAAIHLFPCMLKMGDDYNIAYDPANVQQIHSVMFDIANISHYVPAVAVAAPAIGRPLLLADVANYPANTGDATITALNGAIAGAAAIPIANYAAANTLALRFWLMRHVAYAAIMRGTANATTIIPGARAIINRTPAQVWTMMMNLFEMRKKLFALVGAAAGPLHASYIGEYTTLLNGLAGIQPYVLALPGVISMRLDDKAIDETILNFAIDYGSTAYIVNAVAPHPIDILKREALRNLHLFFDITHNLNPWGTYAFVVRITDAFLQYSARYVDILVRSLMLITNVDPAAVINSAYITNHRNIPFAAVVAHEFASQVAQIDNATNIDNLDPVKYIPLFRPYVEKHIGGKNLDDVCVALMHGLSITDIVWNINLANNILMATSVREHTIYVIAQTLGANSAPMIQNVIKAVTGTVPFGNVVIPPASTFDVINTIGLYFHFMAEYPFKRSDILARFGELFDYAQVCLPYAVGTDGAGAVAVTAANVIPARIYGRNLGGNPFANIPQAELLAFLKKSGIDPPPIATYAGLMHSDKRAVALMTQLANENQTVLSQGTTISFMPLTTSDTYGAIASPEVHTIVFSTPERAIEYNASIKLRFDTAIVRSLIFIVNLYRAVRMKFARDISYNRDLVARSVAVAGAQLTEFFHNQALPTTQRT